MSLLASKIYFVAIVANVLIVGSRAIVLLLLPQDLEAVNTGLS